MGPGMVAAKPREILIVPDEQSLAQTAAERLLARIAQAKDRAAVCLTGGSTPKRLYALLALEPYRSRLSWSRVHWFMGDDRFVPQDHVLHNMAMARRSFLDHVPAPPSNIHSIPTEASSPDAAARLYEAELKAFYGCDRLGAAGPLFDLVLMGVGSDGHTASLFPHSPALDEKARWVVGVDKAGDEPFVPRVTLTFPTLASTREMLFLVSGHDKRDILSRALSGEDSPANRAHSDGDMVWLVDRAAAPEHRHAG
jgi:6-phosphogluconolactonase